MKPIFSTLALALGVAILLPSCTNQHHETEQHADFVPGLGEIMAQTATRHAKLWFAGQAKNWELAAYEIYELREGFEDAGKYHPTHKHIKQPVPELIGKYMDSPLAGLEKAVNDKNPEVFNDHYDRLTAACNACHQSSEFGFNVVVRPVFNPFANQAFGGMN